MSDIDFSDLAPRKRKPTRKERARYKRWRKYLAADGRLQPEEVHSRAAQSAAAGEEPSL